MPGIFLKNRFAWTWQTKPINAFISNLISAEITHDPQTYTSFKVMFMPSDSLFFCPVRNCEQTRYSELVVNQQLIWKLALSSCSTSLVLIWNHNVLLNEICCFSSNIRADSNFQVCYNIFLLLNVRVL